MSDRVFGLDEQGGEKTKKRQTQADLTSSRLEDEAQLTTLIGPYIIRRIFGVRISLQVFGLQMIFFFVI